MTPRAVLLMAYGGPERLDQVEAYYTDIRHGRPPTQALLDDLLRRYRAIGGASPLSGIVDRQRSALEVELARRGEASRVYAGMKHIAPFIRDVVATMADDGIDDAVAIALAPHASSMSSDTYRAAVEAALPGLGPRAPRFSFVRSWHDEPRFIEALVSAARTALARTSDRVTRRVVFTAHSIPARIVAAGDPYPDEVTRTADLVACRLGLSEYDVAFQSAGRTEEPWLGPELLGTIRELAGQGVREIVVCPVGFVADHLEVLYDIDIEARAVAEDVGVHLVRASTMNDDPLFIEALADIALRALAPERCEGRAAEAPETEVTTRGGDRS